MLTAVQYTFPRRGAVESAFMSPCCAGVGYSTVLEMIFLGSPTGEKTRAVFYTGVHFG